jgi:hypothetical protein
MEGIVPMRLAERDIAGVKHPPDDPRAADFVNNLDRYAANAGHGGTLRHGAE